MTLKNLHRICILRWSIRQLEIERIEVNGLNLELRVDIERLRCDVRVRRLWSWSCGSGIEGRITFVSGVVSIYFYFTCPSFALMGYS